MLKNQGIAEAITIAVLLLIVIAVVKQPADPNVFFERDMRDPALTKVTWKSDCAQYVSFPFGTVARTHKEKEIARRVLKERFPHTVVTFPDLEARSAILEYYRETPEQP